MQQMLALVSKWNKSINLVSGGSLADGWTRHVLDSAQLSLLSTVDSGEWLDIGSGAGFPGLIVAILSAESKPALHVTLVESDRRKATFLSEASRHLDLRVAVLCDRIENLNDRQAKIISARAFAPLDKLLGSTRRHLAPDGIGLFPKGQTYQAELESAQKAFKFECDIAPSRTQPGSVILKIQGITDAGY